MKTYTCHHCGEPITGNPYLTDPADNLALCTRCFRYPFIEYVDMERERRESAQKEQTLNAELARLQAIEARLLEQWNSFCDLSQRTQSETYNDRIEAIEQALGYTPTESGKP